MTSAAKAPCRRLPGYRTRTEPPAPEATVSAQCVYGCDVTWYG
ncbi:hypothetical protein [Streptomyces fuscichromogenes]|nr:hypothetical protein [Streptomyces fuscichromogenes]